MVIKAALTKMIAWILSVVRGISSEPFLCTSSKTSTRSLYSSSLLAPMCSFSIWSNSWSNLREVSWSLNFIPVKLCMNSKEGKKSPHWILQGVPDTHQPSFGTHVVDNLLLQKTPFQTLHGKGHHLHKASVLYHHILMWQSF